MGSSSQRFGWFNERGLPFVFLSVTVSESSGRHFAERTEVSESSGRHFAERAAVSEGSESILRNAQPFPRARKAFFPFKSYFRIVDEQKTRIFRDPIYGLLIV